jgi:hypothetical protein
MAGMNGAHALMQLGRVLEAVETIKVDLHGVKAEQSAIRADVAAIKANQRPRRRLRMPSALVLRFMLAAAITLSAAAIKADPVWVGKVLSSMR